jgi:hypothetical protein
VYTLPQISHTYQKDNERLLQHDNVYWTIKKAGPICCNDQGRNIDQAVLALREWGWTDVSHVCDTKYPFYDLNFPLLQKTCHLGLLQLIWCTVYTAVGGAKLRNFHNSLLRSENIILLNSFVSAEWLLHICIFLFYTSLSPNSGQGVFTAHQSISDPWHLWLFESAVTKRAYCFTLRAFTLFSKVFL